MPASVQIGLLVLGAVLLVVALTKGGLKMFNAEVSESAGKTSRIISGVLGLVFIFMAVGISELKKESAEPSPKPTPSEPLPAPAEPTSPPADRPTPPPPLAAQPAAAESVNEPHLDLNWRVLLADRGAQIFSELSFEARQTASVTALAAVNNGEDIFAVEISVANDGNAPVSFTPEKLRLSLEGQQATVIGIGHPRRLKAQRLAPGARRDGLVFVRAAPLLGAALQIGQGELSYGDEAVGISSNHR